MFVLIIRNRAPTCKLTPQGQDGQQYVVLEVVQYPDEDGEGGGDPVTVSDPSTLRAAPPPAPGPSSINVKQEAKDSTKVTVKHGIANSFGFDDDDDEEVGK